MAERTIADGQDIIWPVPLAARRGLVRPAFAWSGFTSAFASILVGARLQAELGTLDALLASILGSWLLFIYSAAIGFAAGRWGLNSQLMLTAVFGRVGAILPGVLLAALVAGWFGFHVMLTTAVLADATGLASAPTGWLLLFGLLFAAPVVSGLSRGFNVTAIAFPAMILFAVAVAVRDIGPSLGTVFDGPLSGTLSFGTGVGVVFGMFVVSGTMTGDIVRYCRTGNEAIHAMAIGFIVSNLLFLILGVLIGAAHVRLDDLFTRGDPLSLLLLGLIVLSHWTTCDACLANASVTLKSAFPRVSWALVSGGAAALGLVLALGGVVDDVFDWGILLSAVVPPIGGIIVADYYVVRGHIGFSRARDVRCNAAALVALAAAVAIALVIRADFMGDMTPLVGAPVAGLLYLMLATLAPHSLGAGLGRGSLGAEAID
ncbi:cytosine permease [Chelatococcus reniformis]|uniref:Cytosine permease n=1 Tax=Chelatococcus reniformis TaxID=1494448 RepID=A0A916USQ9_9HYPH|nr:cytosine permease [Chelatococcus reniformis]GGC86523.1 cytosine permease [Chelatococcus reniformis]